MATTMASAVTASAARSTTTASAPTIAVAITASASPAVAGSLRPSDRRLSGASQRVHTVEVGFFIPFKIGAALDYRCGRALCDAYSRDRSASRSGLLSAVAVRWRRSTATHLGALLFENRLARQLDAVALDGQNFYQHLIAFFQLIANVFNSVFRDFADVQQAIQAGQNLYKCAEVRQAADFSKVGLPYLG
jgi:hypothetical protein